MLNKRLKEAQNFLMFAKDIKNPVDITLVPYIQKANMRLAVSFSEDIVLNEAQVVVNNRVYNIPQLSANKLHRLDWTETDRSVSIFSTHGIATLYVLDEWRRPFKIASSSAFLSNNTILWWNQVVANGGVASAIDLAVVNRLIQDEETTGRWDLTEDYNYMALSNEIAAKTSLKRRVLIQIINNALFIPYEGYTTDGLTQCGNTLFAPSMGSIISGTSQRFGVWNLMASTGSHGGQGASGNVQRISINASTLAGSMVMGNAVSVAGTFLVDTSGFIVGSFNPSFKGMYHNGVADISGPIQSGIKTVVPLHFGATLIGGSIGAFVAGKYPFVTSGAAFSAEQELAQYTLLSTIFTLVKELIGK